MKNEHANARKPLCFILMPFGKKSGAGNRVIDFDVIYNELIRPAVNEAGLQAVRADEELVGGIIQKPMFERLILCEYAVADLTTANANVFYELGIRHAIRPWTTALIFAKGERLPFDISDVRCIPYRLNDAGVPADAAKDMKRLVDFLIEARHPRTDSPVFQLINNMPGPDISRLKTDVFRDRVEYSYRIKERLAEARQEGVAAVTAIEKELGPIRDVEAGIAIDLMLSYRALKAWKEMIALVERMAEPVSRTVMVREQCALALNRDGRGEKAERVLARLLEERGPSSETYGILGRVYKDRWDSARKEGNIELARGLLDRAIDAYLKGFQSDWRDAYPGINCVTLMELRDPPDPRRLELFPVVAYSVKRRIESGTPDYWDHATLLELAVLNRDEEAASAALAGALAAIREIWEPETTLRNLMLIHEAREARGEPEPWSGRIEKALEDVIQNM
jgi:tetratricopeptide (TPR) repeat protein